MCKLWNNDLATRNLFGASVDCTVLSCALLMYLPEPCLLV
jgi:hypothetical protein